MAKSFPTTFMLLIAGVFAALCWSAADVLLVGFVQEPERYPLLLQLDSVMQDDVGLAALMQQGSYERLFAGVIIATFSIVFYLASAFGVYRLLQPTRIASICFVLLFFGYALLPLAHAGFYYLGIVAQGVLSASEDRALFVDMYNRFYGMLNIHWQVAVVIGSVAWFIFLMQVARGQSILPRCTAWLTPLPIGILIAALCSFFPASLLAVSLGGASLNLAQLIFYIVASWYAYQTA